MCRTFMRAGEDADSHWSVPSPNPAETPVAACRACDAAQAHGTTTRERASSSSPAEFSAGGNSSCSSDRLPDERQQPIDPGRQRIPSRSTGPYCCYRLPSRGLLRILTNHKARPNLSEVADQDSIGMGTPMRPDSAWNGIVGIVFDAVGTLIRPDPSVAEAYAATAARQGVRLALDVVRARFQVHFENDEVRGNGGALSTDEATERRRWRKIVIGVLPEIPDVDRAFDELWEHFSTPGSWRCFPDVAPALRALAAKGSRCASALTSMAGCGESSRACPSWRSAGTRSSSRRKLVSANLIRHSIKRPVHVWACRRSGSFGSATTWRMTCAGRSEPGYPECCWTVRLVHLTIYRMCRT